MLEIEERNSETSLRDLCYVLFQHKRKMIVFFVFVMSLAALKTFMTANVYQSEATLFVRLGGESIKLDPTATTGQTVNVSQSRESELNSEVAIFKNRELAEEVIKAIGVERFQQVSGKKKKTKSDLKGSKQAEFNQVVLGVMNATNAKVLKNSNIINVTYESEDPNFAQEVVTKLIEFFLEKHIAVHRTSGSYEFFVEQAALKRSLLGESEKKLWKLRNETGITSVEKERAMLLNRLGTAELEMERTEAELAASRAKVEALRKTLQPTLLDEQSILLSLESKFEVQQRQISEIKEKLKYLNDNEIEIGQQEISIGKQKEDFLKYREHREQARINDALERGKIVNISLVQRPTLPINPIRPKKALNIALGFAAGVFGAFGLALLCAYFDHSIKTPEEAEEQLGTLALASVPLMKFGSSNGTVSNESAGALAGIKARINDAGASSLKHELAELKNDYKNKIARLETDHKNVLAKLKENSKGLIAKADAEKNKKLDELGSLGIRNRREMEEIKLLKKNEEEKYLNDKDRLVSEYKDKKAKTNKKQRAKLAGEHEAALNKLAEGHKSKLAELKDKAKTQSEAVDKAKRELQVEIARIEACNKELPGKCNTDVQNEKHRFAEEKNRIATEYKRAKAKLEASVQPVSENQTPQAKSQTERVKIFSAKDKECYEVFRERLLMTCSNGSKKPTYVLGLVGCHPGQGVSTVSANLASALSRRGEDSVLLVDADVSSPSLHRVFGAELSPGLSDVLAKRMGDTSIQNMSEQNVDILPAGKADGNLSEIFNADEFAEFVETIRGRYNFVIIDIPALSESSSSVRLASLCDGVVMVVEAEQLRREIAQRAKAQLEKYNVNILGIVLNKRRFRVPQWLYKRL